MRWLIFIVQYYWIRIVVVKERFYIHLSQHRGTWKPIPSDRKFKWKDLFAQWRNYSSICQEWLPSLPLIRGRLLLQLNIADEYPLSMQAWRVRYKIKSHAVCSKCSITRTPVHTDSLLITLTLLSGCHSEYFHPWHLKCHLQRCLLGSPRSSNRSRSKKTRGALCAQPDANVLWSHSNNNCHRAVNLCAYNLILNADADNSLL